MPKKKKFHRTTDSNHLFNKHSNKIKGITIKRPEQVWQSDITYVRTKNGMKYLSLITDCYSKKIVGHFLFSENEEKCFVRILANFNFYQKDIMDGFLKYKGKIITFYNTKSKCNKDIIDVSRINTSEDEIENIVDYNDALTPPHEPKVLLFEVKENGVLVNSEL